MGPDKKYRTLTDIPSYKQSAKGKKGGDSKSSLSGSKAGLASTDGKAKEEIEAELKRLSEELNKEREERNYFQLERVCFLIF